jgi:hypothetical protein
MSSHPTELPVDESGEEDPVFISLADLFSLLSLAVIYMVVTFGQSVPLNASDAVVSATRQGVGPGKPIDPNAVYVSLLRNQDAIDLRVVKAGIPADQSIPLLGEHTRIPEEWLLNTIGDEVGGVIYIYVPPSEESLIIKGLAVDTERVLRARYPSVREAL